VNLLLDTHVLLWWQLGDRRLKRAARAQISNPRNHIYVSTISYWEIAIKHALGKLPVSASLSMSAANQDGFATLAFEPKHVLKIASLPNHHNDPFDRALIAQAISGKQTLLTSDRAIHAYADVAPILAL
jgi:PIN domain nuclease of toxin-antitoxin system